MQSLKADPTDSTLTRPVLWLLIAQQQLTNDIPLEHEMAVAIATLTLHGLKDVCSGDDSLALQSAMDCCALVRGKEGEAEGGVAPTLQITLSYTYTCTTLPHTPHSLTSHTPHSHTDAQALQTPEVYQTISEGWACEAVQCLADIVQRGEGG